MWSLAAFVQGLVAGVVTLVVLAVRAAADGRSGVTFADLWTAVAVGIAVGLVSIASTKLLGRRMRRAFESGSASASWASTTRVGDRPPNRDRFDKFTDHARRVLTLAQDEAQRFNHNYIGTEHLLLGLVREGEGVAARVLE
jgi:hypothetical protein